MQGQGPGLLLLAEIQFLWISHRNEVEKSKPIFIKKMAFFTPFSTLKYSEDQSFSSFAIKT